MQDIVETNFENPNAQAMGILLYRLRDTFKIPDNDENIKVYFYIVQKDRIDGPFTQDSVIDYIKYFREKYPKEYFYYEDKSPQIDVITKILEDLQSKYINKSATIIMMPYEDENKKIVWLNMKFFSQEPAQIKHLLYVPN